MPRRRRNGQSVEVHRSTALQRCVPTVFQSRPPRLGAQTLLHQLPFSPPLLEQQLIRHRRIGSTSARQFSDGSVRMRRSRKPLEVTGLSRARIPPPPLKQAGSCQRARFQDDCARFPNRRTPSMEVRGSPAKSTGCAHRWRTTGAQSCCRPFSKKTTSGRPGPLKPADGRAEELNLK